MRRSDFGRGGRESGSSEGVDWELRPGGMLVQKREDGFAPFGPMIKVKVCHGNSQHEVAVPAHSTFGELKTALVHVTGLEPHEQRLLFRGKEKENEEHLHMVGVKDMSKVVLLEDPASRERKLEEMNRNQGISKACEAVASVREEVSKLGGKVSALESAVYKGTKVAEKEFIVLTELLMVQLLKLDGIEAEGEARAQRKTEVFQRSLPHLKVRRVQTFVDALDALKTSNSKPFTSCSTAVTVTTQWETFGSGMGSLTAPPPKSPTKITNDWEQFD